MNGIRWSENEIDAYLRKFKGENHSAVRSANTEQTRCDEFAPENPGKAVHPRYRIVIGYKAKRLADPSGRSHKAAVDGLVARGILGDDSSAWVQSIETSETKCARGEAEETVIELYIVPETREGVTDGAKGSSST